MSDLSVAILETDRAAGTAVQGSGNFSVNKTIFEERQLP